MIIPLPSQVTSSSKKTQPVTRLLPWAGGLDALNPYTICSAYVNAQRMAIKSLYYHNELNLSSTHFSSLPPSRPSSMVGAKAVNALVRSSIDAPSVLLELLQRFDRLALIASSVRKPVDGSRKGPEGV